MFRGPGGEGSNGRRRLFIFAILLLAVWGGALLAQRQSQPVGPGSPVGNGLERYAAGPNPGGGANESNELLSLEDYWYTRISYPTGRVDGRWLLDAARQDKLVPQRVPTGNVTYRQSPESPLGMSAVSWTLLGPQPLQSNGCQGCYTYGHVSGRVNDIEVDPVVTTTAYTATVGGGIWKTTNCCSAATTWVPVTDDPLLNTASVDDLSIDPNNPNTVYVGTGDLNFGSFSMGSVGIYKTTDAGNSWGVKGADVFGPAYPNAGNGFPQYNAVGKVEADPNNSNIVVAGTKTGVYFSYNGGDTWSGPCVTNSFASQRQDVTGLILSDSGSLTTMYVAIGTRGYSTTVQSNLANNGANGIYKAAVPASGCPSSWNAITTSDNGWPVGTSSGIPVYQPGGNTLGRIDIAIAPSNPNYVYAIVQAIGTYQGGVKGVWRTTDGGSTWVQRAGLGNNATEWGGCDRTGQQNWYNQHIEVDPNNPEVVIADGIDIFRSTNGADTFTNISCGYATQSPPKNVHVDQHALEYIPGSSNSMLAGNDGGVYISHNMTATIPLSITFTQLNDSLNTIEFYSGDITANFATSDSPGINAGAQDNGSSVYKWPSNNVGPAMWQLVKGGDGMYARIEPVREQQWYQESQNGNLAVTTNGPTSTLQTVTGGWTADSPRVSFVFPYEIYKYDCPPTGCTHLIAGSYRVWETVAGGLPGGTTWYANSPDLTKNTLGDRSFINQLSYAVSLSTTAIVGTNDGNVQYGFGLGLAPAIPATWVNVTEGNTVLPNRPILDVTTDPITPTIGYAAVGGFDQNTPGTPGHVFRVTCSANCATRTWENKTGNLPNIPADTILANPNYRQQVFVGTDWGFYFTDNIDAASPVWYRFNIGMPNVMIWDMAIDRGFTTLAAFTRGRGAYVWPLPSGPFGGSLPTATTTSTATETTTASTTATPSNTGTTTATPTRTATASTTGTQTRTATASTTSQATSATTGTATRTGTPQATATLTPCSIEFQDVPPSQDVSSFYPYVRCLACRGVLGGYPCGDTNPQTGQAEPCGATGNPYFRPSNSITRGQIAKIVSNAAGFDDEVSGQTYSDVPPSGSPSSFYLFIERLTARNVMGGYPCGQLEGETCDDQSRPFFRPSANATRAQLAKIVSNAAQFVDDVQGQTFADVPPPTEPDDPSSFYLFVERLAKRGVMSGYPCGGPGEVCDDRNRPYFRPSNQVTRAQAAKIVDKLHNSRAMLVIPDLGVCLFAQ